VPEVQDQKYRHARDMPYMYGAVGLGILKGFSMLDSGESIKTLLTVGYRSSFMNSRHNNDEIDL